MYTIEQLKEYKAIFDQIIDIYEPEGNNSNRRNSANEDSANNNIQFAKYEQFLKAQAEQDKINKEKIEKYRRFVKKISDPKHIIKPVKTASKAIGLVVIESKNFTVEVVKEVSEKVDNAIEAISNTMEDSQEVVQDVPDTNPESDLLEVNSTLYDILETANKLSLCTKYLKMLQNNQKQEELEKAQTELASSTSYLTAVMGKVSYERLKKNVEEAEEKFKAAEEEYKKLYDRKEEFENAFNQAKEKGDHTTMDANSPSSYIVKLAILKLAMDKAKTEFQKQKDMLDFVENFKAKNDTIQTNYAALLNQQDIFHDTFEKVKSLKGDFDKIKTGMDDETSQDEKDKYNEVLEKLGAFDNEEEADTISKGDLMIKLSELKEAADKYVDSVDVEKANDKALLYGKSIQTYCDMQLKMIGAVNWKHFGAVKPEEVIVHTEQESLNEIYKNAEKDAVAEALSNRLRSLDERIKAFEENRFDEKNVKMDKADAMENHVAYLLALKELKDDLLSNKNPSLESVEANIKKEKSEDLEALKEKHLSEIKEKNLLNGVRRNMSNDELFDTVDKNRNIFDITKTVKIDKAKQAEKEAKEAKEKEAEIAKAKAKEEEAVAEEVKEETKKTRSRSQNASEKGTATKKKAAEKVLKKDDEKKELKMAPKEKEKKLEDKAPEELTPDEKVKLEKKKLEKEKEKEKKLEHERKLGMRGPGM